MDSQTIPSNNSTSQDGLNDISIDHNLTISWQNTTNCKDVHTFSSATTTINNLLPDSFRYSVIAVSVILSLCGIVGNILASHVFLRGDKKEEKKKKMKTTTQQQNVFLFNMALADLGVLTISYPLWIIKWMVPWIGWPFDQSFCKILPGVSALFQSACLATIVAIAIHRYRTVVYTIEGQTSFMTVRIGLFLIWLLSFVMTSLPVMMTETYTTDSKVVLNTTLGNHATIHVVTCTSCRPVWPNRLDEQLHKSYAIIVWYVLPLLLIYWLFLRIRNFINKQIHDDLLRASTRSAKIYSDRLLRMKRSLRMLVVVVLLYAILLLPWHLFQFTTIVVPMKKLRYHEVYVIISETLMILNSVLKPFVYYFTLTEFRAEFTKRFCGRFGNTTVKEDAESVEDAVKRSHGNRCQEGPSGSNNSSSREIPVVRLRRVDSLAWNDLKGNMYQLTLKRHAQITSSLDLDNYDYKDILHVLNENVIRETAL